MEEDPIPWSASTRGAPIHVADIEEFFTATRDDRPGLQDGDPAVEVARAQHDAAVHAVVTLLAAHVGNPDDPVTIGLSGSSNVDRKPGEGPGEVITIKVVAPDPTTYDEVDVGPWRTE